MVIMIGLFTLLVVFIAIYAFSIKHELKSIEQDLIKFIDDYEVFNEYNRVQK